MGREVKRVPLDFGWPLDEPWEGYLHPQWRPCPGGDCENGSTTAGRWVECLAHLLLMVGEAGISDRPLHPWLLEVPLNPGRKPGPEAAELSGALAGRAPSGAFGHDAIDRWRATNAIIKAAGLPDDWHICKVCKGHAIHPADIEASETWERTDPPQGDGWQLWETVSEGSPISPVFASADELAVWMSSPGRGRNWVPPEVAAKFISEGWAPSLMASPGTGIVSGVEFIGSAADEAE